jgi:2'-5' RNA ligase
LLHAAADFDPLQTSAYQLKMRAWSPTRSTMAIAINLRADDASAGEVERLWDQVAAFEDEPSMRALGYRPHLTFAIYDSPEIEAKTAWEAMLRAVNSDAQLRIAFKRIRWFSGPPLVLWAEPTSDPALARWHAAIGEAIDPAHCRPHYRPGAWTPHCTLGTRIADAKRDDAIAFARSFDQDITVLFDVVDCVTFPPVRVIAEQRLPPIP